MAFPLRRQLEASTDRLRELVVGVITSVAITISTAFAATILVASRSAQEVPPSRPLASETAARRPPTELELLGQELKQAGKDSAWKRGRELLERYVRLRESGPRNLESLNPINVYANDLTRAHGYSFAADTLLEVAQGSSQGDIYTKAAWHYRLDRSDAASIEALETAIQLRDPEAYQDYVSEMMYADAPGSLEAAEQIAQRAVDDGIPGASALVAATAIERHHREPTERNMHKAFAAIDAYEADPSFARSDLRTSWMAPEATDIAWRRATVYRDAGEPWLAKETLEPYRSKDPTITQDYVRVVFGLAMIDPDNPTHDLIDDGLTALRECDSSWLDAESGALFDIFKRKAEEWAKSVVEHGEKTPFTDGMDRPPAKQPSLLHVTFYNTPEQQPRSFTGYVSNNTSGLPRPTHMTLF